MVKMKPPLLDSHQAAHVSHVIFLNKMIHKIIFLEKLNLSLEFDETNIRPSKTWELVPHNIKCEL